MPTYSILRNLTLEQIADHYGLTIDEVLDRIETPDEDESREKPKKNPRQRKKLTGDEVTPYVLRAITELQKARMGDITSKIEEFGVTVSAHQARRVLNDLIEEGVVSWEGERKYTTYYLEEEATE